MFGSRLDLSTRRLRCLLVAIVLAWATAPAKAECGSEFIRIEGAQEEREEACRAIRDVADYFDAMKLKFDPKITIRFSDKVLMKFHSPDGSEPPVDVQVSGFFDPARAYIEVTSPASTHMEHRQPWGLPWSREVAYSILRHELAHAATYDQLGDKVRNVSRTWLELIAYSIQIDLLEEPLKARVLAYYPDAEPLESAHRVNPFVYGYDPDKFAIRAYLFVRANGGRDFIRDLVTGKSGLDLQDIFWTR